MHIDSMNLSILFVSNYLRESVSLLFGVFPILFQSINIFFNIILRFQHLIVSNAIGFNDFYTKDNLKCSSTLIRVEIST